MFTAATQLPVVAEQTLQVPQADPLLCQAPVELHTCGCSPLQVFAPGVQTPVQALVLDEQT